MDTLVSMILGATALVLYGDLSLVLNVNLH